MLGPIRTRGSAGMRRHGANLGRHVMGRGRGRAVRSADARVVLGSAPRQADARVADGIALHLIDCHFGSVAMNKLDKAAALAGRYLDVGDFAETLEEGAKLVLGDIARETTNEHSRIVGVGELIHGLSHVVERARLVVELGRDVPHGSGVWLSDRGGHLASYLSVSVLMGATKMLGMGKRCPGVLTYRVLGVAVEMRMGRLPQYTPCISIRARC